MEIAIGIPEFLIGLNSVTTFPLMIITLGLMIWAVVWAVGEYRKQDRRLAKLAGESPPPDKREEPGETPLPSMTHDPMRIAWIVLAVVLAFYGFVLFSGMTIVHVVIGAVMMVAAVTIVVRLGRKRPASEWR